MHKQYYNNKKNIIEHSVKNIIDITFINTKLNINKYYNYV